jgi:N,N'-diacetyllegionaminate synthase
MTIKIGTKIIGDDHPCFSVGEIGSLFNNFDEAKRLIDDAIDIGLDAIKFQTYEAETVSTKNNDFDLEVTGNVSQYEFFKNLEPSKQLQHEIVKYAKKNHITIFSAPSHMNDIDLMEELDLPIYKIGSDLACHIPLLKKVSSLGKPIILSTGMCNMKEITDSVNTILDQGNDQLMLLHCISDYPAKPEESNLNAILEMKKEFNIPVGFSDHCIGTSISLASVTIGANLIERHFKNTLNSSYPDDIHALTKNQFASLLNSISLIEKAKGSGKKSPTISEQHNMLSNRVSIIIMKELDKGTIITSDVVDIRRPGTGLEPKFFEQIIGKKTSCKINSETPLTWEMLE